MSKALQCDRCGEYFNPENVEGEFMHFNNPDIRTCEDYKAHLSGRYWNEESGREGVVDLCPHCCQSFFNFMEMPDIDVDRLIIKTALQRGEVKADD